MAVETVVVPLETVIVVMSVSSSPRRAYVKPTATRDAWGTGERRELPLTVYGLLTPLPLAQQPRRRRRYTTVRAHSSRGHCCPDSFAVARKPGQDRAGEIFRCWMARNQNASQRGSGAVVVDI